jgi:hypothetical protein
MGKGFSTLTPSKSFLQKLAIKNKNKAVPTQAQQTELNVLTTSPNKEGVNVFEQDFKSDLNLDKQSTATIVDNVEKPKTTKKKTITKKSVSSDKKASTKSSSKTSTKSTTKKSDVNKKVDKASTAKSKTAKTTTTKNKKIDK